MRFILTVLLAIFLLGCSIGTDIDSNTYNGLNKSTVAENAYESRVNIHGYPRQKMMLQQQMQNESRQYSTLSDQ